MDSEVLEAVKATSEALVKVSQEVARISSIVAAAAKTEEASGPERAELLRVLAAAEAWVTAIGPDDFEQEALVNAVDLVTKTPAECLAMEKARAAVVEGAKIWSAGIHEGMSDRETGSVARRPLGTEGHHERRTD